MSPKMLEIGMLEHCIGDLWKVQITLPHQGVGLGQLMQKYQTC